MGAAYMTFIATSGSTQTIMALDSKGQQIAQLRVQSTGRRDFQLHRSSAPTKDPAQTDAVVKASRSMLSGKTDMTVLGQPVTVRQSWEGMRSGKDLDTPKGKFEWRTGGSTLHSVEELTDKRTGTKVASCRIPSFKKGDMKLEILAPLDEFLIDTIVASWVVMLAD